MTKNWSCVELFFTLGAQNVLTETSGIFLTALAQKRKASGNFYPSGKKRKWKKK